MPAVLRRLFLLLLHEKEGVIKGLEKGTKDSWEGGGGLEGNEGLCRRTIQETYPCQKDRPPTLVSLPCCAVTGLE